MMGLYNVSDSDLRHLDGLFNSLSSDTANLFVPWSVNLNAEPITCKRKVNSDHNLVRASIQHSFDTICTGGHICCSNFKILKKWR